MRIKKNQINHRKIVITIVVVAVALVAVSVAFLVFRQRESEVMLPDIVTGNSEQEKINQSTDEKNNVETREDSKPPIQNDSNGQNTSNEITGYVTSKTVSAGVLSIRLTIDQQLDDGECTLILTSASGKVVTKTANVVANPNSATCQGFDIAVSELSPGKSAMRIDIKSEGKTGQIIDEVAI